MMFIIACDLYLFQYVYTFLRKVVLLHIVKLHVGELISEQFIVVLTFRTIAIFLFLFSFNEK